MVPPIWENKKEGVKLFIVFTVNDSSYFLSNWTIFKIRSLNYYLYEIYFAFGSQPLTYWIISKVTDNLKTSIIVSISIQLCIIADVP